MEDYKKCHEGVCDHINEFVCIRVLGDAVTTLQAENEDLMTAMNINGKRGDDLQAENDKLREALIHIDNNTYSDKSPDPRLIIRTINRIATAALTQKGGE